MLKNLTHFIRDKIHRQLHQPMDEMNRLQRVLRYGYDLARFCGEQLRQDRAGQMAAALTYRTIFSLVPTIILMLIVFRAFVSFDEAQDYLQRTVFSYLEFDKMTLSRVEEQKDIKQEQGEADPQRPRTTSMWMGMTRIEIPLPAEQQKVSPTPPPLSPQEKEQVEEQTETTVQGLLLSFVDQGYRLRLASVGGFGLLLLVWAALALAVTVEQCFNRIFGGRAGRPWHHRIMLYWAVLTLGPVLAFLSLYLTGRIYGAAAALPIVGALLQTVGSLAGVFASFILLLLMYTLMPNTRVQLRPAIIGAAVAAILWELGKIGFKIYVTRAVTYSVLYGSIGLLPLFLFWVYLTWLIVLFGLELTYVLQTMEGRKLAQQHKFDEHELITDSRCVLPMMTAIGEAFERGRAVGPDELAQSLRLPSPVADDFCNRLEKAQLIHRVDGGGYALARPADRIAIADLLKLARSLAHLEDARGAQSPGWALLAELNAAESEASAGRTLADTMRRQ